MSTQLLDDLLANLESCNKLKILSILESIGQKKDLGLLMRSEYLMAFYDFLRENDESKKSELVESFYETRDAIERLRDEFKEKTPSLNLYDDYSIEKLAEKNSHDDA